VFVPGKPGPWLDGLVRAMQSIPRDASGQVPLELIVCTDGVRAATKRGAGLVSRLAAAIDEREEDALSISHAELSKVVATLGALRARITIVDRRHGHVHASPSRALAAGAR
jgi:hypothetical protein